MISKNKIKLAKSLAQKKYRLKNKLFLAEGNKIIKEIFNSEIEIITLICTDNFYHEVEKNIKPSTETIIASHEEIKKVSLQQNPQQAIVLCKIPDWKFTFNTLSEDLTLCLDGIQDPGNLGTIIRIADWFGIKTILASTNTADIFNPKVIQASMGAFLRVRVFYLDLEGIIKKAINNEIPIYGTFLKGNNIYSEKLPQNAMIIMGNEGQGISGELAPLIKERIYIPSFHTTNEKASESLNVAAATSIICSEFRRQKLIDYSK